MSVAGSYISRLIGHRKGIYSDRKRLGQPGTTVVGGCYHDSRHLCRCHICSLKIDVAASVCGQPDSGIGIGPGVGGAGAGAGEQHFHRVAAANGQVGWIIHDGRRVYGNGESDRSAGAAPLGGCHRDRGSFLIAYHGGGKIDCAGAGGGQSDGGVVVGPGKGGARCAGERDVDDLPGTGDRVRRLVGTRCREDGDHELLLVGTTCWAALVEGIEGGGYADLVARVILGTGTVRAGEVGCIGRQVGTRYGRQCIGAADGNIGYRVDIGREGRRRGNRRGRTAAVAVGAGQG